MRMNTFILTQRTITARFYAVVTIFSLLLSAFPAAFFVAEAARTGVDVVAVDSLTVGVNEGARLQAQVQDNGDASDKATIILTDDGSGGVFTDANGEECKEAIGTEPRSLTVRASSSNKNFCYKNATPGLHTVTVELQVEGQRVGEVATIDVVVMEPEPEDRKSKEDKVDICHWNNGNGYVPQSVNTNSLGSGHGNSGVNQGDIIPPVLGVFPDGFNWDWGQSWWNNNCENPEPNPEPEPEEPRVCSFAGEVIDYTDPVYRKDGVTPVSPARRSTSAIESGVAPDSNFFGKESTYSESDFFSLGIDGFVEYEFTDFVAINQPGPDIAVWEITGGSLTDVTNEDIEVLVSEDGTNYASLGLFVGDAAIDIAPAGLDFVKYVKVIDQGSSNDDGYDVDAITIIDDSCGDIPPPPPSSACEIGVNLLDNGSFEEPEVTNNSLWQKFFSAATGWVTQRVSDDSVTTLELHNSWSGNEAAEGNQYAELDGDEPTRISQTVATIPGATYELRWAFAPRQGTAAVENELGIEVNGSSVAAVGPMAGIGVLSVENWILDSHVFVANEENTEIAFLDLGPEAVGSGPDVGTFLDGATLCLVREPDPEQPEVSVVAHKIVCTDESELPNDATGSLLRPISSSTAQNWVDSHDSCSFESGWEFEWGPQSAFDPGDTATGTAGEPWTTFGPTDSNGMTSTVISEDELGDDTHLWFREVLQDGYIPFTHDQNEKTNVDNFTAEVYCHTDVKNYDNYDRIDGVQLDETYYCVAWNVPEDPVNPEPDTYVISGHKYQLDVDSLDPLPDWTINLTDGLGTFITSTTTDNDGYYSFTVEAGTYQVHEVIQTDWNQVEVQQDGSVLQTDSDVQHCEFSVPAESNYICDFTNEYLESTDPEEPPIIVTRSGGSSSGGRPRVKPTPLVLGASTDFCPFLTDYMQMGVQNDTMEVMKLQLFLNIFVGPNPVTGVFGEITDANVKLFQERYRSEILNPWFEEGIVPHNRPTGFVYKTTLWKINSIVCPDYAEVPVLDGEDLTTNVDLDLPGIAD